MEHDDDVAPQRERLAIAGLLVGAVAKVLAMAKGLDPQLPRQGDGAVGAGVVDQDHVVDDIPRDLLPGLLQRLFRLVGGKDHGNRLAVEHWF